MDIRTKRLVLRRAKPSDAPDLWDVFCRPEAMQYWSELPHATPERTQEMVDGLIALEADAPYFVIEYQGRAIGTAGYWQSNEIGFILHPRVWGQGIGSEMLDALLPLGFGHCGFDTIVADVDPRNAASIGLLTSKGFVEMGRATRTLQIGDTWVDSVYFNLARANWETP